MEVSVWDPCQSKDVFDFQELSIPKVDVLVWFHPFPKPVCVKKLCLSQSQGGHRVRMLSTDLACDAHREQLSAVWSVKGDLCCQKVTVTIRLALGILKLYQTSCISAATSTSAHDGSN